MISGLVNGMLRGLMMYLRGYMRLVGTVHASGCILMGGHRPALAVRAV